MRYSICVDRKRNRILIRNNLSEVLVSWPCEQFRPGAYPCTQFCRLAPFCSLTFIFSNDYTDLAELCSELQDVYFAFASDQQAQIFINSLKGKVIKKIVRK